MICSEYNQDLDVYVLRYTDKKFLVLIFNYRESTKKPFSKAKN